MIIATSLYDLMKRIGYGWAVYSPSRSKIYSFANGFPHQTVSTTNLWNYASHLMNKMDAYIKLPIAVSAGWTDAVVKLVYITEALSDSNNWLKNGSLLENTTLTPNKQNFALWLIENGYAQIVMPGGDM